MNSEDLQLQSLVDNLDMQLQDNVIAVRSNEEQSLLLARRRGHRNVLTGELGPPHALRRFDEAERALDALKPLLDAVDDAAHSNGLFATAAPQQLREAVQTACGVPTEQSNSLLNASGLPRPLSPLRAIILSSADIPFFPRSTPLQGSLQAAVRRLARVQELLFRARSDVRRVRDALHVARQGRMRAERLLFPRSIGRISELWAVFEQRPVQRQLPADADTPTCALCTAEVRECITVNPVCSLHAEHVRARLQNRVCQCKNLICCRACLQRHALRFYAGDDNSEQGFIDFPCPFCRARVCFTDLQPCQLIVSAPARTDTLIRLVVPLSDSDARAGSKRTIQCVSDDHDGDEYDNNDVLDAEKEQQGGWRTVKRHHTSACQSTF